MELFKADDKEYLVVKFPPEYYVLINLYKTGKYKPQFADTEGLEYLKTNTDCGLLLVEEGEVAEIFRTVLFLELEKFITNNKLQNQVYLFFQGTGQETFIDDYIKNVPKYVTLIQSHSAAYNFIHHWNQFYSPARIKLSDTIHNYTEKYAFDKLSLEKRFLVYSGKTKNYRLLLLNELIESKLLDQCYYNFGEETPKRFLRYVTSDYYKEIYKNATPSDLRLGTLSPPPVMTLTKKDNEVIQKLLPKLPMYNIPNRKFDDYYLEPYFQLPDHEFFKKIFVDITVETYCFRGLSSDPLISNINFHTEKLFKPTLTHRPFIVLGNKNYLKDLKNVFGFKTFDKFWDESYDDVDDARVTIKIIIDNLKYLNSLSLSRLENMLFDMKDILVHNNRVALDYLSGEEPWKLVMQNFHKGLAKSWTGLKGTILI